MHKRLLRNRHIDTLAALLAADALVFGLIDPVDAAALWLIAGYLLFGLTLLCAAALVARTARAYGAVVSRRVWRLLRYGVVSVILLIGLQSIGQLTVKDVLTLGPCLAVAYVYFGYTKRGALADSTNST